MQKVIQVKNLTKTFTKLKRKSLLKDMFKPERVSFTAVKNITFSISQGESVGFLGPNGAGKTTTVKMMTGLIYPTSGDVEVLGYKPSDRKRDFLMNIGLVMGNKQGLNWDLTARQSFQLIRKIYDISDTDYTERLDRMSTLLNVSHVLDTQVRKLSLGERMKVELIGAILHQPKVLFLDEPTIGLDIIAKQSVRKFLRQIQREMGVTLLLTSHDMDDIENVCDRVIVINKGEKIYDNSLQKLTMTYSDSKFVKVTYHSEPLSIPNAEIVERHANAVTYKVERTDLSSLLATLAQYDVDDIDILSVPLEEMIRDIFERKS